MHLNSEKYTFVVTAVNPLEVRISSRENEANPFKIEVIIKMLPLEMEKKSTNVRAFANHQCIHL